MDDHLLWFVNTRNLNPLSLDHQWHSLKSAILKAATDVLPKKKVRHSTHAAYPEHITLTLYICILCQRLLAGFLKRYIWLFRLSCIFYSLCYISNYWTF